jgi:hypothetical protein
VRFGVVGGNLEWEYGVRGARANWGEDSSANNSLLFEEPRRLDFLHTSTGVPKFALKYWVCNT